MSLSDLSNVLEAAIFLLAKRTTNQSDYGPMKPTLLRHNVGNCILVNVLHRLDTALVDCRYNVYASYSALPVGRSVQQSRLEVRIQLGIQLPVITEQYANRLVRVNASDLQVGPKRVLQEVSMVVGNLKAVRASNLHQGLIPGLSGDRMRQFL